MKTLVNLSLSLSLVVLATACDMLNEHPYDADTRGVHGSTESNVRAIERNTAGKSELRVVVTSDTQGWYDDTRDFVASVNAMTPLPDFVVHTGDLSDYGMTDEFLWQHDILKRLRVPFVTVIGNHDHLGTGENTYERVFGPTNYSFIAARVKWVMINTNALEYDFRGPVPDLDFISRETLERADEFDRSVVVMHAPPFCEVFKNDIADEFEESIRQLPGLMFCLDGHQHAMRQTDYFGDGIIYYETPNIAKRGYYLITINNDGYDVEKIAF